MKKSHRRHKQHYDQQLSYFELEFSHISRYHLDPWQKSYVERARKFMLHKDVKNKKFLDIASGLGHTAIEMAKKGLNVVACDLSPTSINNLNKVKKKMKLKNLKLILCYAEKIPLPSNSIDYISANAILEHIPDEQKAIKEWLRLLKKGGRLYITVPLKFKYIWPFFWPINFIYDRRIGHLRRYDLSDLQKKFNLKVRKVFYTGHLIKVIGTIIKVIYPSVKLEELLEHIDDRYIDKVYGASNISVIFEK